MPLYQTAFAASTPYAGGPALRASTSLLIFPCDGFYVTPTE